MEKYNTNKKQSEEENKEANKPEMSEEMEKGLMYLEKEYDLEKSAQMSGALIRRRGIGSARDLLRMVLGYSVLDFSLRA